MTDWNEMEQLKREYREAQQALNEGRTADAHRHVRAAGRELDVVAEALRRRAAAGSLPGSDSEGIDAQAVAALAGDITEMLGQVADLAGRLEGERKQVRAQQHWRSREPDAAPVRGGCLDFSR